MSSIEDYKVIYEDAYLDVTPKWQVSPATVIEEVIGLCISEGVRKAYILFKDGAEYGNYYKVDLDDITRKVMAEREKVAIK